MHTRLMNVSSREQYFGMETLPTFLLFLLPQCTQLWENQFYSCVALSSEKLLLSLERLWDYRQKNARTLTLVSPLELLKGTRLALYLYSTEYFNSIGNCTQAVIYRVFQIVLTSLKIFFFLSVQLASSWELSRFPVTCWDKCY